MNRETIIGILITTIISVSLIAFSNIINFKEPIISWIILIASVVLIFIIVSINAINESRRDINFTKSLLKRLEKDLNISERLPKMEAYFEYLKMKKRGQAGINWLDLIKVAAIIILGYIIIKALIS